MNPDNPGPSQPASGVSARESDRREADRQSTRLHLRRVRQQLDPATVALHSRVITTNCLPLLGNAQHIGLYLAFGNEVSADELMAQCRAQGQATYVPLVQPDHTLKFAPITNSTPIVQNRYGIREPELDDETCLPATSLDVVIVPLLGFDRQCNRMGMGGGYYDRTFAHKRQADNAHSATTLPLLIGVAFDCQCVDSVFPDWWDVPLDHVVTERQTYSR